MFFAGMATSGRTSVGYIFANEFFTPKWQVIFGSAFCFLDGSTGLIIALYFDFINKHYRYIVLVGFTTTSISIICTFLFVCESPLWQLKIGRIE